LNKQGASLYCPLGPGTSVAFTMDTYAHVLPHMQETATARVEELLYGARPEKKEPARERHPIGTQPGRKKPTS
jgi:hypothetical protein